MTTGLGTNEACGTVDLKLTGRTGHYEGTGTGVGAGQGSHQGPCKSPYGIAMYIDFMTATVQLDGGGTGTISFTYTYRITTSQGTLNCDFSANEASITYTPTSSQIHVSIPMTGSGGPGCLSGVTHGTFTMTSENEPVSLH